MILHSHEIYFHSSLSEKGPMSCKISGQEIDEASGHQHFLFISNDTSLLK